MAGGRNNIRRQFHEAIGFFGLHIITAGRYVGTEYVDHNSDKNTIKKLVIKDGLLKGYILVVM